jgi:hypothetical protein
MANISEWKKNEIKKAGAKFDREEEARWWDMVDDLSHQYSLKPETVEKLLANGKA